MPSTDKLPSYGFVCLTRIESKEFKDSGKSPKLRAGTVLFPIRDRVGAYAHQFGDVFLE